MTPLWTSAEAVEATWGVTTRPWTATGVSIDTRTLQPGDLFVALSDVRDGHDFVAQALEKGAAAALVSHIPAGLDETAPLLIVDKVLPALEAMGRFARARTCATVIGVTGSVGKTSAKEMLRTVLSAAGRTHAAEASYNNHWGVPLTLARMPKDADFAVIEIGMNHPGEIEPLSRMAAPHVAMITTIAAAHLEAFENLEGIAHEKASIFGGLVAGGTAVVNRDVPQARILLDTARAHGARIIGFGEAPEADYRLLDARPAGGATVVQAQHGEMPLLFKVMTGGRHFAMNALAVIATAEAAGADPAILVREIANWAPPAGRGTREKIALDPANEALTIELIDDAFNANPTSMAAALEVLADSTPVSGIGRIGKGRRIAILGDMLELGPDEAAMHLALGDLDSLRAVDIVHAVGPRMKPLFDSLPEHMRGRWVASAHDLAEKAHGLVDAGDVVLVKGSKGSKVSLVVDAIRKLGHRVPGRGILSGGEGAMPAVEAAARPDGGAI
ncbi:UDP-N-acetylmuramoyl-tripeptide--D-alanyl-D-alanine ligase [Oceaniglobus roseus]|uniref:UDP-N-acetylmuramoyl-tripeptide--D-alanyl-D- alanine ligase n=1 Tax=Oceaniglobus roseus TaxID=1737570 RepID=UPI000C7EEF97|nr:UDP-N-acetylmuramoyl-tripeptide--D-alanyl-D-alanine ligase [Kandeliimicrobium roseum]